MNIDENGNLKPEHIQIDRSSRSVWEESITALYKQTVDFPADAVVRSAYEVEIKYFVAQYPDVPANCKPDAVQTNREPITQSAFDRKSREIEIDNLHQHVLNSPGDQVLQAAYTEEVQAFVDDFPEQTPDHLVGE